MTEEPTGGGQVPPPGGGGLGGDPEWLNRHQRPKPHDPAAADQPGASGSGASGSGASGAQPAGPAPERDPGSVTGAPQAGQDAAGEPGDIPGTAPGAGTGEAAPDQPSGQPEAGDVVEGEIIDSSDAMATDADALLAEVFDADQLEADLAAMESGTASVSDEVAGLTSDLKRVQAEFLNFKRRVERDRELEKQRAVEAALATLLPVLDEMDLAAQHGEFVGGFKNVGDKLVELLARLGLNPFGEVGEPFDPNRHEALMREEAEGVTEPTVVRVLQVGYTMNGRIIRAARVSVAGAD